MAVARLVLGERIDAETVATGLFRLPLALQASVIGLVGEELLLIYSRDDMPAKAIGIAHLAAVEIAESTGGGAELRIRLSQFQKFATDREVDRELMADPPVQPVEGERWAGLQSVGTEGGFGEAAQADVGTGEPPSRVNLIDIITSYGRRCAFTGETLPAESLEQPQRFVLRVVPGLYGGDAVTGNVLPAQPDVAAAWARGWITVNDRHEIIVNLERLGDELRRRLRGSLSDRVEGTGADPHALRLHRERIFESHLTD